MVWNIRLSNQANILMLLVSPFDAPYQSYSILKIFTIKLNAKSQCIPAAGIPELGITWETFCVPTSGIPILGISHPKFRNTKVFPSVPNLGIPLSGLKKKSLWYKREWKPSVRDL